MSHQQDFHCQLCDERARSKSDWLFHMILSRHNLKARNDLKLWLRQMRKAGDIFVISGLESVDNSMLLEFLSERLQSFRNIVFFKPQANICIFVCNQRELTNLLSGPLPTGFKELKYQLYQDVSKERWASFFKRGSESAPLVPQQDRPDLANNNKRKFVVEPENFDQTAKVPRLDSGIPARQPMNPSASSVSTPHNFSFGNFGNQSPGSGSTSEDEEEDWSLNPIKTNHTRFIPADRAFQFQERWGNCEHFETEIETIFNAVMLPKTVRDLRSRSLLCLKNTLRRIFPKCEIIPVGADFLGFNLESDYFTVYFDSQGVTNPSHPGFNTKNVISELQRDIDRVRTSLFNTLKNLEKESKITDLKCEGADKIRFVYSFCKYRILLKSFMMAQTARLCKQLFFMDTQAPYLLILVTYWAMQYSGFTVRGSSNPFIFNWLIYFFLMLKNSLPPVIELQKPCNFEILDKGMNVAFEGDERIVSEDMEKYMLKRGASHIQLMIETLLEWFIFMDDTFGETNTKGVNRRHSLICPRYCELIDKRKFKVCREQCGKKKKRNLTSKQKRTRNFWQDNLKQIGFDESTWGNLSEMKLPDTLSIQHPLYISENIGLHFDGPFSKFFFSVVGRTRVKLIDLVGAPETSSLINVLRESKINNMDK